METRSRTLEFIIDREFKKKENCTIVQALRFCTGPTTHRGSSGIAYAFMTTALEVGEGSDSRPGLYLPPGKTRYPLYRRLGGPQGRSGQVRKTRPHRDSIPGPVQPVASRCTDYTSRPPDRELHDSSRFEERRTSCRDCWFPISRGPLPLPNLRLVLGIIRGRKRYRLLKTLVAYNIRLNDVVTYSS